MAKPNTQALRLLLLPISTRRALVYCEPGSHSLPTAEQTYLDRAVGKAASTWSGWETAESVGNWKRRLTGYGNTLLRRIPFEEWGLKSVPALRARRRAEYEEGRAARVEVRYPGLYQGLVGEGALAAVRRLATERQGLHKTKLWQSVVLMPVTIPFGLIPVLPNLPFLYLAFRAYSHYRALYGSRHLDYLATKDMLVPRPSRTLDALYTAGLWHSTAADAREAAAPSEEQGRAVVALVEEQVTAAREAREAERRAEREKAGPASSEGAAEEEQGLVPAGPEEVMLLKGWNAKLIADRLELPELQLEIERAVEQVERDLRGPKSTA